MRGEGLEATSFDCAEGVGGPRKQLSLFLVAKGLNHLII